MLNIKNIIFLFFLASSITAYSQTITVTSSTDNKPLPKARIDIQLNDTIKHYSTNLNGQWEIGSNYINQPISISISYSGHETLAYSEYIFQKDKDVRFSLISVNVTEFEEVAITAQYKTQLVEKAVHNIKVIDSKQIEAMAAQNVKEALNNELNIHLSEDNILGTNIQLQGIGGENVKILIDGVPITGRQNGNIDLSQIPIESVERIEVVEGPLSVSYGTDALAGTINIITKKNQANRWEGASNNYFESSGKMNNSLSLGTKFGKHQIRLQGGRQFFDGWDPSHNVFHFKQPIADSTRSLLWKPKTQWFGGVNYQLKGDNSLLNIGGQFLNEDIINRGLPRAPYFESAFDDYYNTIRVNQNIDYQHHFRSKHRINITGGYSGYFRNKNTKLRDLTTIEDVLTDNPEDHDTSQYHSFMLRGRYIQAEDNKNLNYEVGFDILHEIANGKKIEDNRQDIGDYAIYTTAEYSPFPFLTIRPGIRYSYNTEYKAPLTPSLNIRYGFLDREKHKMTLRGSYARGFRAPSIKELYYTFVDANHDIVGNKDLKAEKSDNISLSLHQNLSLSKLSFRNKLTLFYNNIYNQIALSQISNTEYSYFNINRFTTTGFQVESNMTIQNFTIGLGIGYIGRQHKIDNDESFDSDKYLFSPSVNGQVQYNWKKIDMQFALFYRYSGELPQIFGDENGNYSLAILKDYQLADLKITKSVWNKRLVLSAGIKNIFNVINVEGNQGDAISAHSSGSGVTTIGMGRTYHVGILLKLNSK